MKRSEAGVNDHEVTMRFLEHGRPVCWACLQCLLRRFCCFELSKAKRLLFELAIAALACAGVKCKMQDPNTLSIQKVDELTLRAFEQTPESVAKLKLETAHMNEGAIPPDSFAAIAQSAVARIENQRARGVIPPPETARNADGSLKFEVQTEESAHNFQAVQARIFGGRLPPDCLAARVQKYLANKSKEEREKGLLMFFTGELKPEELTPEIVKAIASAEARENGGLIPPGGMAATAQRYLAEKAQHAGPNTNSPQQFVNLSR